MKTSISSSNRPVAEPVKDLGMVLLGEHGGSIAAKIKKYGLQKMIDRGYIQVVENPTGVQLHEPVGNIAAAVFESGATVARKIKKQGLDTMLKRGYVQFV